MYPVTANTPRLATRHPSAEGYLGRNVRGVLPMDAEILPEVAQQLLADRLALCGLQKLGPEGPELVVRDRCDKRSLYL
jgi:hypothetical protein